MKILHFDLETKPILAWIWSLWTKFISIEQIEEDWMILCWAAKWHQAGHVMYAALWHEQDPESQYINPENEYQILLKLWYLLDEADVVVAHNARKFDVKKFNAKCFEYGLTPPQPYKVVDTLETSKKSFGLTSHKLDYTAKLKGYGNKLDTKFDTWLEVIRGNKKTRQHMLDYNIHDVELLEDIYTDMLPWMNRHPVPQGVKQCKCGSTEFRQSGTVSLTAGVYQTYRCKHCGSWYRDTDNTLSKDQRKATLRNVL